MPTEIATPVPRATARASKIEHCDRVRNDRIRSLLRWGAASKTAEKCELGGGYEIGSRLTDSSRALLFSTRFVAREPLKCRECRRPVRGAGQTAEPAETAENSFERKNSASSAYSAVEQASGRAPMPQAGYFPDVGIEEERRDDGVTSNVNRSAGILLPG